MRLALNSNDFSRYLNAKKRIKRVPMQEGGGTNLFWALTGIRPWMFGSSFSIANVHSACELYRKKGHSSRKHERRLVSHWDIIFISIIFLTDTYCKTEFKNL